MLCRGLVRWFRYLYLREPTTHKCKEILRRSQQQVFSGILGSIYRCKWKCHNCPVAWHGQFEGKEGAPTATLRAIADSSFWIWHPFFGTPGSCNDINVLDPSPLVNKMETGNFPSPGYIIKNAKMCEVTYHTGWRINSTPSIPFLSTLNFLGGRLGRKIKDPDRAFSVLQSKWHVLVQPCCSWSIKKMTVIMKARIVLHNMMFEDSVKNNKELYGFFGLGISAVSKNDVATSTGQPMRTSFIRIEQCSTAQ